MRPAFILFAIAAFAVARPLEANSDVELVNHLKHTGQLDAVIEQAFQQWLAGQDDVDGIKDLAKKVGTKVVAGAKALKKAADDSGFTAAVKDGVKEVGRHLKTELVKAGKDVATHGVNTAADSLKKKISGGEAKAGAKAEAKGEAKAGAAVEVEVEEPKRRAVDDFDAAVEQAIQEWAANQDEASIAVLVKGLNELD